ncbi:MAG: PQQ-binding-like beta-propeller repeat protein [Akkermansiaceae bacterium]|nr:PQQ-binding-like beta-propeller repeat protein [Akkermansiaceae bacterium]
MPSIPSLLIAVTSAFAFAVATASEPSEAWSMFGRDLQNTHHYPQQTGSNYKMVWSKRAGCPAPGMAATLVTDMGMFNTSPCSNSGDTHATSLEGEELWANSVGQGKRGIIATPCFHDGTLYSIDNGFIKAFDAKDGALKWKEEVKCGKVSIASPIAYEGVIFLSGTTGIQVTQIDRAKSAQDTVIEVEDCHGASTPAFHDGSMVALALQRVHCFDVMTLKPIWQVDLSEKVVGRLINSPIIDIENGRVFVASSHPYRTEGRLHCLSLKDGEILWQQDIDGIGMTSGMSFDGKQLFVASMKGTVSAHDVDNGKAIWKWSLPGENQTEGNKVDHKRKLDGLISSKNKLLFRTSSRFYIISNDHPDQIDFELDLGVYGASTPAFYDGDLFIRYRPKDSKATNFRYTEIKQAAAPKAEDLEVKIVKNVAHIRNLSQTKLNFYQLCFGINVNEKQNCMLWESELQPGAEMELDLEQFFPVDDQLHHLLLALEYEKPDGTGKFQEYFTINP